MNTAPLDFTNRSVLITGGSRGIGLATAIRFVELGANVAITYHSNEAAAKEACARIEAFGRKAISQRCEASDEDAIANVIDRLVAECGTLDVAIANAGIWRSAPIDEMTIEDFREMMEINMTGTFVLAKHAARVMKQHNRSVEGKASLQSSGSMIFISSTAGQRGEAGHSHYAASKGAQISFTKSLAVELAPFGIRVNAVAPGWVDTDMTRSAVAAIGSIGDIIPIGRPASTEDIANAIVFLASDLSRHITGEILNVNGGAVLCG